MRLVELCVNNPNEDKTIHQFNKGAVRFLTKEFKGSSKKLIRELEKAISEKCSNTGCVTISASSERRLLVAHRRCKPQVIYCRLWRWPDLQSHHQLKSLCSDSPSLDGICINPYHYERIVLSKIEPILVPCSRIPPDLSSSIEDSEPTKPQTKSFPASLSFINRLDTRLYQPQSHPARQQIRSEQAMAQAKLQTSGSLSCEIQGADESVPCEIETSEPILCEVEPSGSSQDEIEPTNSFPCEMEANLTTPQPLQQQEQYHTHTQYQSTPLQPHRQQCLQAQTEIQSPLRAQEPFSQSQFASQQQPNMSYLNQSQYHSRVSQSGVGQFNTRTEPGRPYQFGQKVYQDHPGACRELRHNAGYIGRTYSQRMTSQAMYQMGPVQRDGMVLSPMGNVIPTSQQMCSSSNSSFNSTSPVVAQQNVMGTQIPNPDYQTMYAPQPQYQATGQPYPGGYPPDAAMSNADQQSGFSRYPSQNPTQNTNQNFDHLGNALVIDMQEVPYVDDKHWCSISYHEYDQRLGEKYHSNRYDVAVDGFTRICNDRFCLGRISNINRNQFTEWVRRRIGKGVKLIYADGNVHLECESEASVFVSNPLYEAGNPKALSEDLVVKLSTGSSFKVFDTREFGRLLRAAVNDGFEAVYRLTSRCVVRVSFVKGWGKNYKRQSIFNTPCWIEVQLNGPLQWIDKILRQMRPPTGCCSTS